MNKAPLILLILGSQLLTSCLFNKQEEETDKRAKMIIDALERYNTNVGSYPDSLRELIPGYIHSIPFTGYQGLNNEFYYQRDNSHYQLWYFAPLGVQATYKSIKKKWEYDD